MANTIQYQMKWVEKQMKMKIKEEEKWKKLKIVEKKDDNKCE